MPFEGPEGQGPFSSFQDCVSAMEDEEGIDDPEALCGYWKELDENQANAMTEPPDDEPEYRTYHQASASEVTLREVDDESENGLMSVRMPIASTGDVRNGGDDPLTRDELDGMARQINERDVGVFLAHGDSFEITDARYGQTERLGTWREAEVSGSDERDDGDGSDLLMATAEMPDPETLPSATGRYREALAIIKEQAKRDVPLSASIGWREDEDAPGGNDLMEASIVGIPADPRTVTQGGPAVAVARAAVDAGADPEPLVDAFRSALTGDRDPATDHEMDAPVRRHLSSEQAETATRLLKAYREEQGNGSVANFESWLWNVAWNQFDENEFHAAMTALEEFYRETTPLEEPVSQDFRPFLDARKDGETNTNEMTDNDTDESDEQSADANDDAEQTERQEAPEWAERMLELQEQTNETLETVAEAVRQDDDDEDDDEDEDQAGDDDEDDEDEDQAADVTADQREALDTLREGGFNVDDLDLPEAETDDEQDADADSGTADSDPDEDATKALLR